MTDIEFCVDDVVTYTPGRCEYRAIVKRISHDIFEDVYMYGLEYRKNGVPGHYTANVSGAQIAESKLWNRRSTAAAEECNGYADAVAEVQKDLHDVFRNQQSALSKLDYDRVSKALDECINVITQ